jgi:hypothetical protein
MENQNITLSIRKDILQKVKILAAKQRTSVSGLMTNLLEDIVARDEGYQNAQQKYSLVLQQDLDLGTKGVMDWSRDELHAR